MEAIAAYHAPLGSDSLRRHSLVSCFLWGAMKLRPASYSRVPAKDVAIVLEDLLMTTFEPIESASGKFKIS